MLVWAAATDAIVNGSTARINLDFM
jgi:hypothetical protein